MSEQTMTVNGAAAGVKKNIMLPSRPKKRLFIGMLSVVTLLAAALLFGIWYIGVPGLTRIHPVLPWALGGCGCHFLFGDLQYGARRSGAALCAVYEAADL